MANTAPALKVPKVTKKKKYIMSDGILRVTQEIEIKDYASILFYDWHLYCLDADIRCSVVDSHQKQYLLKAREIFAEDVAESKPNKRADVFGKHSVFFHLYGHTKDWVRWAQDNVTWLKDVLTVIQGANIEKTLSIIRNSKTRADAKQNFCDSYGIQPFSAAMLVNMPLHDIVGLRENYLKEEEIPYAENFLLQVIELAAYDSE